MTARRTTSNASHFPRERGRTKVGGLEATGTVVANGNGVGSHGGGPLRVEVAAFGAGVRIASAGALAISIVVASARGGAEATSVGGWRGKTRSAPVSVSRGIATYGFFTVGGSTLLGGGWRQAESAASSSRSACSSSRRAAVPRGTTIEERRRDVRWTSGDCGPRAVGR